MSGTLVIAPNWIGDAIMAQPLLALEKQRRPEMPITVLAPEWVAPVLAAMPEVDAVIGSRLAHGRLQWQERRSFARSLRASAYDRAYVLPNSFKSALIPFMAGIPERIGYRGEMRFGLLNRRYADPAKDLPMVRRYAALGGELSADAELPPPRLTVSDEQIAAVRARFALDPLRPLFALCPGAEYGPAKRWPARHFAGLAQQLASDHPHANIVLLGGPGDRGISEEIATTAPVARVLAGDTSLAEAIALIASATAVVSNDSGLMHVAAALGRPQVAVFGSSDPRHTPPLSGRAEVVWLHVECSPCFQRVCPLGHTRCLNEIEPALVQLALQRALALK